MQALDHSPALSPDRSGAVFDPLAVDLALFGCWEAAPGYRVAMPADDPLADEVRGVVLETKSAEAVPVSAAEELRRLLNEMTVEMRSQFEGFRDMRVAAERLLDSGDEAAGKLARADIKAATDAMSLIVRTLEKVDSLQRQLARDRADEAERTADASGYGEAKERLLRHIKERVREEAALLFHSWQRDGPPADLSELVAAAGRRAGGSGTLENLGSPGDAGGPDDRGEQIVRSEQIDRGQPDDRGKPGEQSPG